MNLVCAKETIFTKDVSSDLACLPKTQAIGHCLLTWKVRPVEVQWTHTLLLSYISYYAVVWDQCSKRVLKVLCVNFCPILIPSAIITTLCTSRGSSESL